MEFLPLFDLSNFDSFWRNSTNQTTNDRQVSVDFVEVYQCAKEFYTVEVDDHIFCWVKQSTVEVVENSSQIYFYFFYFPTASSYIIL